MRVGILAPGYPPAFKGGGPIRSIYAIAKSTQHHTVSVFTANRDLVDDGPLQVAADQWLEHEGVSVYYASASSPRQYARGLVNLKRRKSEILYVNSFFNTHYSIVPLLLHRFNWWGPRVILLLAPRGEFGAGALALRPRRKSVYLRFVKLLGLHRRVVWHATNEDEVRAIRKVFPNTASIVLRPNDTALPSEPLSPQVHHDIEPRIIFVSRIARMKGLDVAIEAISQLPRPTRFDIYGTEEDTNYVAICKRLAERAPPHIRIRFHGSVTPNNVRERFNESDLFVLPTRGENFGHVIAESLSASCPVMVTNRTPWTSLLQQGGGIIVRDTSAGTWGKALKAYCEKSFDQRQALVAEAGRLYVRWHMSQVNEDLFKLASAISESSDDSNPNGQDVIRPT